MDAVNINEGTNGTATALVVSTPGAPFEVQEVELKELRPDEIIVRMAATGVCHTDFAAANGRIPVPTPVIVGHEGSGVVEKVGSEVKDLAEGDHVLLSFPACMKCKPCLRGNPSYCVHGVHLSFGGCRLDGSVPFSKDGRDIHSFFNQSSFAHRSIVNQVCAVKVDKSLPLDILCPLACGIQTGAGTVLNILKPGVGTSVAVYGVGSVGLAGIIAASKLTPATKIIAIDIDDKKLAMAKELGATHAVNSKDQDVVKLVKDITDGEGADCAYDTTGIVDVIHNMIEAAAHNAIVATVGSAPLGSKVQIEISDWIARGIHYAGSCQGSSVPRVFIPALIEFWKQGRFPVDRLIKRYHFTEINKAREDVQRGDCIKGVLLWDNL
ncbi:alcohol dehydrogenase [Xylogone sp. PMI_703]|nr:alcohol dehydrogenase [Xylogone sp. PMI_703]